MKSLRQYKLNHGFGTVQSKERGFKKCRMYILWQKKHLERICSVLLWENHWAKQHFQKRRLPSIEHLGACPALPRLLQTSKPQKAAATTLLQTHSFDIPFTFKGIFATCPNKRNPLDHSICSVVAVLQTQGNKTALKKPKGKLFSTTPLMELILFMWQTHLLLRHWCHILHNADVHHPRLCHINILLKSIAVLHFQTAIQ